MVHDGTPHQQGTVSRRSKTPAARRSHQQSALGKAWTMHAEASRATLPPVLIGGVVFLRLVVTAVLALPRNRFPYVYGSNRVPRAGTLSPRSNFETSSSSRYATMRTGTLASVLLLASLTGSAAYPYNKRCGADSTSSPPRPPLCVPPLPPLPP